MPASTCGSSETEIQNIMEQIDSEASSLGIEVLGGHTEVTEAVNQNVVVATALGKNDPGKVPGLRWSKNRRCYCYDKRSWN